MPTTRMSHGCFLLSVLLLAQCAHGEWSEAFHDDANLHDIFFVSAEIGWCVGDRGTIYHTRDAGATWERQNSPANCSLESVHFLDPKQGWIVGGRTTPYTQHTESVVLTTKDGGTNWKRLSSELVPWLKQVRFYDHNNGIACGLSSNMYPSGLVTTEDGGLTWTGLKGRIPGACLQFSIGSNRVGFGVTSAGRLTSVLPGSARPLSIPTPKQPFTRPFVPKCVTVTDRQRIIIGGSDGTIRTSVDGGTSWGKSTHSAGPIELRAMASLQNEHWVCGSPGNVMLKSTDDGESWRTFRTGNTLPLNAIAFANKDLGWAVGNMGTVLQTTDGGRTWRQQSLSRRPPIPRRAAFMVVTDNLESMPWEPLAELCAAEGFRAVIVQIGDEPSNSLPVEWQASSAASSIGANVAITLPSNSHAGELAREIQIWKPDALLVHGSIARGAVLDDTIVAAVDIAERSNIRLNLEGHSVGRIATIRPDETTSRADQVVIELSTTTSELASNARALFTDRHTSPSGSFQFVLSGASGDTVIPKPKNLMTANAQMRGQSARRLQGKINATFRPQQNSVVARRNIRAIARQAGPDAHKKSAQLLHQLPAHQRARLMFEFACKAEREGDYDTAITMLERVVFDSPNHPFADVATQMLIAFKASAEVELARGSNSENVATTISADAEVDLERELDPAQPIQESRRASFAVNSLMSEPDAARLAELVRIQKIRPSLFFSPTIRFPVAAFQRRSGRVDDARRFYRSQLGGHTDFAWRSAASTELGIDDKKSPILKPLADGTIVSATPYLDGKFDEPLWNDAKAIELQESQTTPLTSVRITCDQQFLYVAIECAKSLRLDYSPTATEGRRRDADMRATDHVSLRIDCDRDYATFWQFSVDSNGNGHDCLNENTAWNPVWYIAHSHTDTAWNAEIAIHLDELTDVVPSVGDAWGIDLSRSLPAEPAIHWPASRRSNTSPQDFGLLQFAQ